MIFSPFCVVKQPKQKTGPFRDRLLFDDLDISLSRISKNKPASVGKPEAEKTIPVVFD